MSDILNYVKNEGNRSLEKTAFNEVDALILSRVAYFPFECVPQSESTEGVRLGDAAQALLNIKDIGSKFLMSEDKDLCLLLRDNKRFSSLRVFSYINEYDEKTQVQFSAVCVQLNNLCTCIAFRGTDATLVGWKENFNMGFMFPVPAQTYAQAYLEKAAPDCTGSLILCGHSKGGNLALFAASFCNPKLQKKISRVYSFDAPGFSDDFFRYAHLKNVEDTFRLFVPQSSIVGKLLRLPKSACIVKSNAFLFAQHDVFSWRVEQGRFVFVSAVDPIGELISLAVNGVVESIDKEQQEEFVENSYEFLKTLSPAITLTQLYADLKRLLLSSIGILGAAALVMHLTALLSGDTEKEIKALSIL